MKGPLEQINYTIRARNLYAPVTLEQYTVGGHTLTRVAGLVKIKAKRFNGLEANIQPNDYPLPAHDREPLVACCGVGTDSLGYLIAMRDRGIRPDVVQWADTGTERAHTYEYVNVLITWLEKNDFPPLLIVRKVCPKAGHRSLFEQLWNTEQLPSPAFMRNHSCSAKWKIEPQRDYHRFVPWLRDASINAIGFSAEETNRRAAGVTEAIGFSAEETKRKSYQAKDDAGYVTWYPLQEWNITRQDCVDLIEKEGLPQPSKSACFLCPMSKRQELDEMPTCQLSAAIGLEARAAAGGKLRKITGLRIGNAGSWADWIAA